MPPKHNARQNLPMLRQLEIMKNLNILKLFRLIETQPFGTVVAAIIDNNRLMGDQR